MGPLGIVAAPGVEEAYRSSLGERGSSFRYLRHASGDDERHDLSALRGERCDLRYRDDDKLASEAVGLRDVDRDVIGQADECERLLRQKSEHADAALRHRCDEYRFVEASLFADERIEEIACRAVQESHER